MAADDRPQLVCHPHQRGDVEARLPLDLVADFARALDHDDAFQSGPIMAFLQPSDIMEGSVGSGFDAAVVASPLSSSQISVNAALTLAFEPLRRRRKMTDLIARTLHRGWRITVGCVLLTGSQALHRRNHCLAEGFNGNRRRLEPSRGTPSRTRPCRRRSPAEGRAYRSARKPGCARMMLPPKACNGAARSSATG